jgi:choline-sulfatase
MFPHFPLIAPKKYYDLYPTENVDLPDRGEETLANQHPVIRHLRYFFHNDQELPEKLERKALASYYALTTLTDDNVGRMLAVINGSPLAENTIVIYTSDHGEMGGNTVSGKSNAFSNPP